MNLDSKSRSKLLILTFLSRYQSQILTINSLFAGALALMSIRK